MAKEGQKPLEVLPPHGTYHALSLHLGASFAPSRTGVRRGLKWEGAGLNPAAGRGRLSGGILQAPRPRGAKAFLTEEPGHAAELARQAPPSSRAVAVGGDGTVHEVLLGMAGTGGGAHRQRGWLCPDASPKTAFLASGLGTRPFRLRPWTWGGRTEGPLEIPIAPMASPKDGVLHGVLAGRFSRLGVLGILPRLHVGRHLGHREIRVYAGRRFTARFRPMRMGNL